MSDENLLQAWPARREQILAQPGEALAWIKNAIGVGEYRLAIQIAESFLAGDTSDCDKARLLAIRQKLAVAFYRSGSTERAKEILQQLLNAGETDGETLGLLGSVNKILWGRASKPEEKEKFLRTSRDFYRRGFETRRDYYCGINAATLSVLLDDPSTAKQLAEETLAALPAQEDSWSVATDAEAHLILGDIDRARELYARAVDMGKERWTDIVSTRRQCRLLRDKMLKDPSLCLKAQSDPALAEKLKTELPQLDSCFPKYTVAIFAGHMIDVPDRPTPRFPAKAIPGVEERIEAWLRDNKIRFAYSSAACGGDIIFLERAQALGIETHLVLSFAKDVFIRNSVDPGGPEWRARFEQVIAKAKSVSILNEDMPDHHDSSYDFTNRMNAARAAVRTADCEGTLLGLALWDGQAGGIGGTATAVEYWSRGNIKVLILHPTDRTLDRTCGRKDDTKVENPFPRIYTADPDGINTTVATMLLLRFNKYHSIREQDFADFSQQLLDPLADALALKKWFPARYGFGDQYLFVWDDLSGKGSTLEAGLAAVEFLSRLQAGMQACETKLDYVLCLDAAPVQVMVNPILNQYAHEGAAISKLELLAPKLSPGAIYATEAFASLSVFEKIRNYRFDDFGTVGASQGSLGTRLYRLTN